MKIAQEKSKHRHDKNAKQPEFKLHDRVLLKSCKVPPGQCPNFSHKFYGPFYITELGPNFTYKLVNYETHEPMKDLINAKRLKKYSEPIAKNERPKQNPVQNPGTDQEKSDRQPKKRGRKPKPKPRKSGIIVRMKLVDGVKHFRFRNSDSWFPITDCEGKDVEQFFIEQAQKKKNKSPEGEVGRV